MINQKISVMMLVLIASITAIPQYALASSNDDQGVAHVDGAAVDPEVLDLDVEEAVEAENTTMPGNANQSTINATGVQFLAIQRAQSGSLTQINETAYALELNNVANKTNLFSDRPDRVVETVSTVDFVRNWTTGLNSFSEDEPNDALIVKNAQTGDLETAVIESSNPVYNMTTNTLTYRITGENGTAVEIPSEFGQSVLVIDMKGNSIPLCGKFINSPSMIATRCEP